MRNRLNRWLSLFLVLALTVTACSLLLAACQTKTEVKDYYNVVYHLNYGDNAERAASVKANTTAIRWRPVREGYIFEDWHTSAELTEENVFDFSTLVDRDLELYAEWSEEPDSFVVSFDFNYYGSAAPVQVAVEENTAIPAEDVPESGRIGQTLVGWCKDEQCTQPWNMETDIVTEDMTLYADYEYDSTVNRDANGNIIYDNVTVDVWIGTNFTYNSVIYALADAFNEEYKGRIQVNATTVLSNQNSFSLRIQQTPERNTTNGNYRPAADVYDLAGIDYSFSDWYESASCDSFVEGRFQSVPLLAGVPYIIYNKDLMQEYNRSNPLPNSFSSLSELLNKVYAGESASVPGFNTIVTNTAWTYREAPSAIAFMQNDADYYSYEDSGYVNKWSDPQVFERAVTSMQNTYDLFGVNGALHGYSGNQNEDNDVTAVSRVADGTAFMGCVNFSQATVANISQISNFGILPLSGLFTDGDYESKNDIPVHTIGLAFYKAQSISNTQLAAAAVFADYMSKNSYAFAELGWYPVRKSVAEGDAFTNSDHAVISVLKQCGEPENFRTFDGYVRGKTIVNSNVAFGHILPILSSDGSNMRERVTEMMYSIENNIY